MEKKEMPWVPLNYAVNAIAYLDRLHWITRFRNKYLSIRIDTRDKRCVILDRDDNILSLDEWEDLKNQSYVDKRYKTHN